jgi:epoxide hydrolase-like predicted phosphatase
MGLRAVVFDFGGVLVRTEDRTPRERLAARLGLTYDQLAGLVFNSQSARRASLGEITTQEHWDALRQRLGLSPDEFPDVPIEFWGGDTLDRELVDYIQSLRSKYKTGLISNAWDDLHEVLVKGWKIAGNFDQIVISAEVGVTKPDPEIYRIALRRLAVKPQEAVFVDDFPENVEGAREVGMQAIQFKDSIQVRDALNILLREAE